jgi:hypothetical protein
LDNASIHKTREVQHGLASKGYTPMYTPPYSPEFNPIEHCFGAIKTRYYRQQLRAMQAAQSQSTLELAQACVQQYLGVMSAGGLFEHLRRTGVYACCCCLLLLLLLNDSTVRSVRTP